MVMMDDLVNLSLDEIIKKQNAKFRSKRFGGQSSRGRGARKNWARPIPVVKNLNRRPQSQFVIQNAFPRGTEKLCTVKISNLGPMVTTADLQELFAEHPVVDCAVHYDEMGNSLGTAVVFFQHFDEAMRLKRQYTGAKLDGRVMNLFAVSNESVPRVFPQQPYRRFGTRGGRINKRGGSKLASGRFQSSKNGLRSDNNMGGFRAPGRGKRTFDPRKKMTAEDLDRELDAYMHGSKHSRIVAP